MSDQLFEVNDKNNMSFEYEGINNFEHNFDDNYINNENVFSDENDNYDEGDYHTDNNEGNTVNFLPITSYFFPTPSWIWKYTHRDKLTKVKYCTIRIDNKDSTSERCKTVFQPKTLTTNIAAHLRTEHRIFKTQKWDASPITTVNPTSVTQPTIETIIQKQIENTLPLPEKQQSRIAYQLINQQFEVPCTNTIKNMMKKSTQNHVPYIGITAYWLSENFTMYKSLITIEHFFYPHTDRIEDFLRKVLIEWDMFDKISVVITDNASSMNKAIRQLGTPHLGCTAHTIHLAVTDGLKQCETLIGRAKSLNNFLVNHNKYRSLFRKIQREMIEKKNNDNATKLTTNMSVLDPISSDTITRWNFTYFVLQRLLELQKPILELATNLTNNPDRTIHADGNNLNEKILTDEEWTGLEEICQILRPFAQALTFIGSDHYLTLSMMYPTVRHLFKVLDQIEHILTNLEAIEMHQSLRTSMVSR
ncbi:8447_t:CDS:2 [Cetraspora pellucida]|uniref:8447_t:CDS:1 n=1 Tax=Cetraspora pellucida TaxID=1433469 RepID=A0ACA9L8T8_9GLOM|nr:8447_t:CDS:2 [Cetraspora pellucida]